MATNPLYSTNDSPNNSTQPTKSVNRQGVYVPRTHNTFDNSYFHFKSQKFGQYEPFYVMEGVAGDVIPLHSSHHVRTNPLRSPFESEIRLNKDYFLIPNQAIQPNTWEYSFALPTQGDDVPEDVHNLFPIVNPLGSPLFNFLCQKLNELKDMDSFTFLRYLLICENFFSQGSLLYNLGYKLNPVFTVDGSLMSFDDLFEYVLSGASLDIQINTDDVNFSVSSEDYDLYTVISLLRRFGSSAEIVALDGLNIPSDIVFRNLPDVSEIDFFRMDRVNAYQLACAQYYVNPNVDFIYNAQLYRDNFMTLLRNSHLNVLGTNLVIQFFDRNGISVPYDYFSRYYYNLLVKILYTAVIDESEAELSDVYDCIHYLFGFRESLRFGDYFSDSRTRPLAIGDNGVPVVGDSVDVIDMSHKVIMQRFRNAVVKLSNNFGDYLRGIFGESPSPDYHIPKFISHNDFVIKGFEVANSTEENQGKLVTNLSSGDDTFAFEVKVDMPCIIVGISYFSVPRVYSQTKERQFFHKDRYDMFNPMTQYFGDQRLLQAERRDGLSAAFSTFAYNSRNSEYKQRYSQASGAFVQYLPAWTFVTDSLFDPLVDIDVSYHQSPEFIRAHDYEFNRFFGYYNGVGLSKGYHFGVTYNNKCMSLRPMEINPSTL